MPDEMERDAVVPDGFRNWQAVLAGAPESGAYEYALYTDAQVVGQVTDELGPYALINALPHPHVQGARLTVALRVDWHLDELGLPPMDQRRDGAWHGAGLDEEIAALLSLALGMRCRSGGQIREFKPEGDVRGHPTEFSHDAPVLPPSGPPPHLPLLAGKKDLGDAVPLLGAYPHIEPEAAVTLLRAARAYQQAVWQAENDPEYAWLKLVSAVETAANWWWVQEASTTELLESWNPELVRRLLTDGGEVLVAFVADKLVPVTRATRKFLDFLTHHLPTPPVERPAGAFQVDWDRMPELLADVYAYRSTTLHDSRPMPGPMLDPPVFAEAGRPAAERPIGLAASHGSSVWMADDMPMHLHVFEYVVRRALQKWWASLSRKGGTPG